MAAESDRRKPILGEGSGGGDNVAHSDAAMTSVKKKKTYVTTVTTVTTLDQGRTDSSSRP
jgi:hypothetical protein